MKLTNELTSIALAGFALVLLSIFLADRPTSDFESWVAVWTILGFSGVAAGFGWQARRSR